MQASLIVTTYNWPEALEAVLRSALDQWADDYEIIVADDGSSRETGRLVQRIAATTAHPVLHVWQPDRGFRAARVRNRAVAHASGDYLIFIDGDSLVGRNFVADHLTLAERGYFVAGSRVWLGEELTREILDGLPSMPRVDRGQIWRWWLGRRLRRVHGAFRLHLPPLRYFRPDRWQAVFGCNMALHRDDFIRVNGFDNGFVGWGHEDSELAARLYNAGIPRKEGKWFSYVGHLHHAKVSRHARERNRSRLQATIRERITFAADGYREAGEPEVGAGIPDRSTVFDTSPVAPSEPGASRQQGRSGW